MKIPDFAYLELQSLEPGIWILRLNRPECLNAMSSEMLRELAEATEWLHDAGEAVRALIVRGAGEHFMAGGDIRAFAESLRLSPETRRLEYRAAIERWANPMVERLVRAPFPVIAEVRGACAGFGLSLALCADVVVAAPTAYFTTAYLNIGLTADGGMSYLLPRLIGQRQAARWLLLAERFSAEEARAAGVVTFIEPEDRLEERVLSIARQWTNGPRQAIARMKRLLAMSLEQGMEAQLLDEADSFSQCAAGPEFAEGVMAFLQKRAAKFS